MPDPVLFLKAILAAAGVSAIFVLAFGWYRKPASTTRLNAASVLGISLGIVLGYSILGLVPEWPPTNGLDRFLTIVGPAVVGIELIAGCQSIPRRLVWILRLSLAAATGRILLHGSIYLAEAGGPWTAAQVWLSLAICGALPAAAWSLMLELLRRSPGVSLPLAISQSCLCGGLAVMLAGYVSGGEATLPLAAALAGAAGAACLVTARPAVQGAIGIGMVGLFGLLFVGRFFGRLSTGLALTVFLAPLLCWVSELPMLHARKPWVIATVRLALVAIPLVAVFVAAKRDFDRTTAPLLGFGSTRAGFARSGEPRDLFPWFQR
jgi:hypothetical protein